MSWLTIAVAGNDAVMGWLATMTVFVAMVLGGCFVALQNKALREEFQIARKERATHPDPDRDAKSARTLIMVLGVYGSLAAAFYVGWRAGGATAGAISAVSVALIWVLGAAVFAIKSAWVSRR
jgi:hypothetical protein